MRQALLALLVFCAAMGSAESYGGGRLERVAIDPGGQIWHVAAHDGVVIWTQGRRLVMGRLDSGGRIEPTGSLVAEGIIDHLACVGQRAVAAIDSSLHFVDLSDPALPRIADRVYRGTDTWANDLEILPPYVLSADRRGMRLWDASDPGSPRILDGWGHTEVRDLSVGEAGLGLATSRGFVLLDPTDPPDLVEIGSIPEESNVTSGGVGRANAVIAQPWAISVVDLSDPTEPEIVGRLEGGLLEGDMVLLGHMRPPLHPACISGLPARRLPLAWVHDMAPCGDTAAVVAVSCEESPMLPPRQILHLVDLHDPTRPRVVDTLIPDSMVDRFAAAASRVVAVTSRQPRTLASLTSSAHGGLVIAAEAPLPGLLQSMSPFGDRVLAHVRRYGADELLSIDPVTLEMRLIELDSARCPLVWDVSVRFPWVVVTCWDGFGEAYRWSESADPRISKR